MSLRNTGMWLTVAMVSVCVVADAGETDKPASGTWLVALAEEAPAEGEAKAPAPPAPEAGWTKPIPIGFSIDLIPRKVLRLRQLL